ncbi:MAG: hypothetical protein FXF54_01980 [Kosmotoga sp.]|nr:MAG: hypothetical protein FXF54_01980 [Kosmotoga sp.]
MKGGEQTKNFGLTSGVVKERRIMGKKSLRIFIVLLIIIISNYSIFAYGEYGNEGALEIINETKRTLFISTTNGGFLQFSLHWRKPDDSKYIRHVYTDKKKSKVVKIYIQKMGDDQIYRQDVKVTSGETTTFVIKPYMVGN